MKHNKIVLLGREGVGKSCLVHRFRYNEFCESLPPTVGAAFMSFTLDVVDDRPLVIGIWDTAGQERFDSILPMYIRKSAIVLLCIDNDVADVQKYTDLKNKFSPEAKIFLVVTKCDEEKPEDFYEEIKFFGVVHKTSAKTGDGVTELFENIKNYFVDGDIEVHNNIFVDDEPSTKSCCWK